MSDTLRHHPLADIFPLMEGAEFNELVADIKASGLHEPIILLDDLILDGRNRYRACVAAGVEPSYRPFTGEDPGAFVISANIRRRHLNTEQKRAVIAKLLEAHPEKSDRQIAETAKASPTTVGTVRAQMESTVQSGLGVTPSQNPRPRPPHASDQEVRQPTQGFRRHLGGAGCDGTRNASLLGSSRDRGTSSPRPIRDTEGRRAERARHYLETRGSDHIAKPPRSMTPRRS